MTKNQDILFNIKFLWINHTADAYYREISEVAQNTSNVLENKIFHTHRKK
jgi:hypothetical protein